MHKLRTIGTAILTGLVYFGVLMGVAMGLVMLNSRVSPATVWFPLPVTALLVLAVVWAERRWRIGMSAPSRVSAARAWIAGAAITVVGIAAALIHGKYTGVVRATELLDADVSPLFQLTYAIYMSVFAAVLAEVTFRGVIQARIQTVLSVWPTVFLIGAVNVLAHRWGPELAMNWLGWFVALSAWTWLRWFCQSVWPPLVYHGVANLVVAIALWKTGPFYHRELSTQSIALITCIAIASLAIVFALARRPLRTAPG